MDFAATMPVPVTVSTVGLYSQGVGVRAVAGGSSGVVSTAWGTANLAIYTPIYIPFRYPVRNLFVFNFATVNGNVDVRIYNKDYVAVTPSVNTAQAGATALQFFAVDVVLDPGQYYLGISSSSTTATVGTHGSVTATRARYLGLTQQATANPLPATATPAAMATLAKIPCIGMTFLSGTPAF